MKTLILFTLLGLSSNLFASGFVYLKGKVTGFDAYKRVVTIATPGNNFQVQLSKEDYLGLQDKIKNDNVLALNVAVEDIKFNNRGEWMKFK